MGLADTFGAEDRVQVKFSDFYKLMKQATQYEIAMNAVGCDVPHRYIRECMGETDDPYLIEWFKKHGYKVEEDSTEEPGIKKPVDEESVDEEPIEEAPVKTVKKKAGQ